MRASCGAHLRPHLAQSPVKIHALPHAAIEKFKTFAAALEVDFAGTGCGQRLERWLAVNEAHLNSRRCITMMPAMGHALSSVRV